MSSTVSTDSPARKQSAERIQTERRNLRPAEKLRANAVLILTLAILIAAGLLQRSLRETRACLARRCTLPVKPLAEMPSQVGPFTMVRYQPIAPDVLRVLDVDEFVHCEYVHRESGRRLGFYTGYWGRENVGMGHGPEVCYPMGGWTAVTPARKQLVTAPGTGGANGVPVLTHRFERAEPPLARRLAVASTTILDGRLLFSSIGHYRHKPSDVSFLSQLQVYTPIEWGSWEEAEAATRELLIHLLPHVAQCLPMGGQRLEGFVIDD